MKRGEKGEWGGGEGKTGGVRGAGWGEGMRGRGGFNERINDQ